MKGEFWRLHIALGFLLLSVIMPILGFVAFSVQRNINAFILAMIYLPALPLAIADSIWNLGQKEPATEFSSGYLWLLILNIAGSIVSLYWIFASYPTSLIAIRNRYAGMQRQPPQGQTNSQPIRPEEKMNKSVMGVVADVLCPYCLDRDSIQKIHEDRQQYFTCTRCNTKIPNVYMNKARIPREVVSAVGFRGHGKTVYFASLFNTMDDLANLWPGFYTQAADEHSLDTVIKNIKLLKAGTLPDLTPANFPDPTIVLFSKIPILGDRFFLFYDTGGENYERASMLIQNANFVKRSHVVTFIVSLDDLIHDDKKMHELLSVYVQGLAEIQGTPKSQHLIVVLSKGERLEERLQSREDIWHYFEEGGLEKLGNGDLRGYISDMKRNSVALKHFVKNDLKEAQFLNFATSRFRSVEFCIVSALGAEPDGNRLRVGAIPKRIMDPMLWVIYKSMGLFQKSII